LPKAPSRPASPRCYATAPGSSTGTLAEQFSLRARGATGRSIRVDGALLDPFKLVHGVWEAKDSDDDLKREADQIGVRNEAT